MADKITVEKISENVSVVLRNGIDLGSVIERQGKRKWIVDNGTAFQTRADAVWYITDVKGKSATVTAPADRECLPVSPFRTGPERFVGRPDHIAPMDWDDAGLKGRAMMGR